MNRMKLGITLVVLAGTIAVVASAPAQAGVVARAGLGQEPDQFVVGGQIVAGRVLKIARFAPSVDVGFGDDLRTVAVNADVMLPLLTGEESGPVLYASAGPTLARWSPDGRDGDTDVGWSLAGGARRAFSDQTVALEVRFGFGDVPDLRILLGLVF